jgi:hypothetical protein
MGSSGGGAPAEGGAPGSAVARTLLAPEPRQEREWGPRRGTPVTRLGVAQYCVPLSGVLDPMMTPLWPSIPSRSVCASPFLHRSLNMEGERRRQLSLPGQGKHGQEMERTS